MKNTEMLTMVGGMVTTLQMREHKGRNFGVFNLSSNIGNVSVFINDEELFDYLNRNARKGTQMTITGSLSKAVVVDGVVRIGFKAKKISLLSNFGAEYVAKQDAKVAETA